MIQQHSVYQQNDSTDNESSKGGLVIGTCINNETLVYLDIPVVRSCRTIFRLPFCCRTCCPEPERWRTRSCTSEPSRPSEVQKGFPFYIKFKKVFILSSFMGKATSSLVFHIYCPFFPCPSCVEHRMIFKILSFYSSWFMLLMDS